MLQAVLEDEVVQLLDRLCCERMREHRGYRDATPAPSANASSICIASGPRVHHCAMSHDLASVLRAWERVIGRNHGRTMVDGRASLRCAERWQWRPTSVVIRGLRFIPFTSSSSGRETMGVGVGQSARVEANYVGACSLSSGQTVAAMDFIPQPAFGRSRPWPR
jgi:hypothetical protein